MARLNRSDADGWASREEQCPERGPGLTHTQEDTAECVHCGEPVVNKPRMVRAEEEIEFTDQQVAHIEFLRYLRREGRI